MAKEKKCRRCVASIEEGRMQCPFCRAWQFQGFSGDTAAVNNVDDGSVTLDQVVSSDLDRLQTGEWDICWGANEHEDGTKVYGVTKGSTTLIGGSPGAGKSTLTLQIAATIGRLHGKPKSEPLYIASEEQLKQIKQRAIRLKMTDVMSLIRMVPAMSGGVNLNTLLARYRPPLMILDSLKGMVGENDEEALEVCKIFKQYCMSYDCPGIIATHVTKDEVIAGKLTLQHEVDTTMTFFPDTEYQTTNGESMRVLESTKNRNGKAFQKAYFAMTELGLVFLDYARAKELIIGLDKEDALMLGFTLPEKSSGKKKAPKSDSAKAEPVSKGKSSPGSASKSASKPGARAAS